MTRSLYKIHSLGASLLKNHRKLPILFAMFGSIAMLIIIMINLCYKNQTSTYKDQIEQSNLVAEPLKDTLIKTVKNNNTERAKRLPQAIIIGARKCGTRALLKFLDINNNIRVVENEVHFFDKPERYQRGIDWYREQMVESMSEQITIEKSPSYFVTNGVAHKVAAMNQSTKLIIILRDPIVRLISDYSQIVANKIELNANNETSESDIEEAWQEAAKLFEQHLFRRDGSLKDTWRAVQLGMYSKYLEKWLNVFPINQFHFVDGERLITEPHRELQLVERFLHLNSTISEKDFVFDQKKGFYCIAIKQEQIDGPPGANSYKQYAKVKAKCLSKHKGRRHIRVNDEIVDKLKQFYSPYNEYLFSLIGKQFAWSSKL